MSGLAFFKKPREDAAVPVAHKSAITRWQAGRDWPRALTHQQPGVKGKTEHVPLGSGSRR